MENVCALEAPYADFWASVCFQQNGAVGGYVADLKVEPLFDHDGASDMRSPRSQKLDAVQGSVDSCGFSDMVAAGEDDDTFFGYMWPLDLEIQDKDALDRAYADSALAAAASTTKLPSPRGHKRGRGTADADDAAGGARGAPRRRAPGTAEDARPPAYEPMGGKRDVATQVSEADLLPPVMRDASTQFPEVEERSVDASPSRGERSPVDNDQRPVAAGGYCFPDWKVLGDDSFVPLDELGLELFPVDRTDEGCVAPDAMGNVSEDVLKLQQLPPFDFTEAATDIKLPVPTDEEFLDFLKASSP